MQALQLVKRIRGLGSPAEQRAEVAIAGQRFAEAEAILRASGEASLALDMYATRGNWLAVRYPRNVSPAQLPSSWISSWLMSPVLTCG